MPEKYQKGTVETGTGGYIHDLLYDNGGYASCAVTQTTGLASIGMSRRDCPMSVVPRHRRLMTMFNRLFDRRTAFGQLLERLDLADCTHSASCRKAVFGGNYMQSEWRISVIATNSNDRDKEGQPVVIEAGPGTSMKEVYRGRVFQTEDTLAVALCWPEQLLGSPVAGVGAVDRMNGQGQPMFYGAIDPKVCIAELRPPVGSRIALAAFEVIRPLRLLDLRRLATVELRPDTSLFDAATRSAAQRRDFLKTLGDRLSAPVVPELQDRDYLVMQVVADYLAAHRTLNVDGIIYPSAQSRCSEEPPVGDNIVLFCKASGVSDADGGGATAEIALWEYEEDGPDR